ncbi:type II toxin-antitoxin system VapC family toxin [Nocardia crassostreae]|uniref:type II toxin-antitoxin system VapC family toxin n=1 Tax=Nocardia crassostreae TaxID=53428 RepID=UPI0009FCFDF1|nr:PIN domain-containing protein [Nocardia crassostreae]
MIIADTSGILASIDTGADHHAECVKVVSGVDEPLIVSHMVVTETDYLLTTRFGVATANRFLSDVVSGAYRLAPSDEADIATAININTRYADHSLGIADCMNVVLAQKYHTVRIFTLDERHFRMVQPLAYGPAFQLLPFDL